MEDQMRLFVEETSWYTDVVLWAVLPEKWWSPLPHFYRGWLRNYIGGTLLYLLSGIFWCLYIYYLKRNVYVPKGVCSLELEFIYVLSGWEGSAHDGRVLRDAISRPYGLKVPRGTYYLCDAGYTNGEGFLAPYRGQLYHLREWNNGPRQPRSAEEYFNLRHAMARNVIERCFGLLKGRWGILRSPSWFSFDTHSRIVIACCLLHNLIKRYMPPGSLFDDISDDENSDDDGVDEDDNEVEYLTSIDTTDPWTNFRNSLAQTMFNNWRAEDHRI